MSVRQLEIKGHGSAVGLGHVAPDPVVIDDMVAVVIIPEGPAEGGRGRQEARRGDTVRRVESLGRTAV